MKSVFSVLLLLSFAAAAGSEAHALGPAAGSGLVEGHILCSDGSVPARGADVRLVPIASLLPQREANHGATSEPPPGRTDFDGYYLFHSVSPGTYIVDARKDGYSNDLDLVRLVLDRLSPDQQNKLLATFPQVTVTSAGAAREDVVLHRAGAIMGRVSIDTGGAPPSTRVLATLVSSSLTGDVADRGDVTYARNASTDDRGMFRVAGLPPGKYRLQIRLTEAFYDPPKIVGNQVTLNSSRPGTAELTVYPPEALTESEAKLVEVGDGDELTGVDISIPKRKLHSIGGTVTVGGSPPLRAWLTVLRDGKKAQQSDAVATPDGSYRFDLLPSGTYTIEAHAGSADEVPERAATKRIVVLLKDNDVIDANVNLPQPTPAK